MTRKTDNGLAVTSPRERGRSTRDILDLLVELVPQLARGIGPNCEVVLHDNRTKPQHILAIGNGHLTQRSVGDLMTRISIADIDIGDLEEPLFNYQSLAPNGMPLRVSLLPIVIDHVTVAYLAINYVTADLLMAQKILAQLTQTEPHAKEIHETFVANPLPVGQLFERCMHDFGTPPHLLARKKRIELIRRLHDEGAFRLRGAVPEIAARLGISRAAVYGYLKLATAPGAVRACETQDLS